MSVKVTVPGYLPDDKVVEVAGSTIGECLRRVAEQQPDLRGEILDARGHPYPDAVIVVNGETMPSDAAFRPVQDGDEIRIAIVAMAGCG